MAHAADPPAPAGTEEYSASRLSVSTASSLTRAGDAEADAPYRDDDTDDGHNTSRTAAAAAAASDGGSGGYPPPRPDGQQHDDYADDLDLEDPEALADDVAFIQKQRSKTSTSSSPFARRSIFARIFTTLRGPVIVLTIIAGALILIPLLQWLSSSPFASTPIGDVLASIPGIKNTTLFNMTLGAESASASAAFLGENHAPAIPEVGMLTGNLPSASKYGASADTQAGGWGLGRAKGAGFQTHFYVPGWADAASAAQALNISVIPDGIPGAPELGNAGGGGSGGHLRPLDMDSVFDNTFYAARSDLVWVPEDPDEGVFSHVDPATRDIILEDVTHARLNRTGVGKVAVGGGRSLFVQGDDVTDERGNKLYWSTFSFSPNMRWVMFFSGRVKQWRHSGHSYVYLHDILARKTYPLQAPDGFPDTGPTIAYARWIPLPNGAPSFNDPVQAPGPALAFVHKNDLYVSLTPTSKPIRVTSDGAASIFNGVPDWVYEEEVFGSDFALWPSPTGTHLAYLRFDEREVPVYEYPIYNPDAEKAGKTEPYPGKVQMKYPKPGFANPVVSVHSVDLEMLRKVGDGKEPSWQQVQAAKRVLVSPAQTKKTSSFAGTAASLAVVDAALAAGPEALHSRLVIEVVWLTPTEVLIKESNRVSDKMRAVVFDLGQGSTTTMGAGEYKEREVVGEVVRSEDADRDQGQDGDAGVGGWIEPYQTVRPLNDRNGSARYIDLAPSPDGFRHIALFDPSASFRPQFLTAGKWEVDKIKFVDDKRGKVYFTAAYPTASQRHLFEVSLTPLPAGTAIGMPKALTDVSKPGFFDASFDPKGAYYTLYENGPGVPTQRVLGLGSERDKKSFELVLEDNSFLKRVMSMYLRPSSLFYTIEIESEKRRRKDSNDKKVEKVEMVKVNVSAREFRPHDFDASGRTRYPVLIYIYGGPNSQSVDASFARPDWHAYLSSTLGYLVITLDGRGTGFQGFGHRSAVTGALGGVEAADVVEAARKIGKLAYVDEKRIGVRGWSYGGYLTSKVLERDSGVFSLGMAVAPVSKWEFYDTIYTERYMKTPALNPTGYESSAVHITDGFRHTDFFLASGSADDNVHPTNIYHLLDSLTAAQIRRYEFRHFTDSDHGISMRGAFRELHEFMTAFLQRRWGAGGRRKAGKPMLVPRGGRLDRPFGQNAS
ncbi:unnamed protein product [Tilletia controversa]|uniref:Dipeptidyl-peptidase IV n=1 Tax=Tilletia caries TaxID=13290 RepID=A0A177TZV1_9BASI|nr:hypothetical protein A4X03_0g7375 [Tilletia caries]CAD6938188.1 unnamed protein product [Tilletia controversa]